MMRAHAFEMVLLLLFSNVMTPSGLNQIRSDYISFIFTVTAYTYKVNEMHLGS